MKEEFVTLEIATILKEKGFPGTKFGWTVFDGKVMDKTPHNFIEDNGRGGWYDSLNNWISCPTQEQVMKWLREKHKIHLEVGYNYGYFPVLISTKTNESLPYKAMTGKPFTYEKAVEVGLKFCLEHFIK